jgi:hypothetical protein
MKKQIGQVASILVVVLGFAAIAGAGIVGSKHDLTITGFGNFVGANDEVCIYCHTPHAAVTGDRYFGSGTPTPRLPLWNRSLNESQAFTMYTSPTYNATNPADGKPTGYSLLCLSCHDGVATLGAVINNSGGLNPPIGINLPGGEPNQLGDLGYPNSANVNIGTDISNDHPVSFDYAAAVTADTTANGGVQGIQSAGSINAALKLPGGRMECTTCHDPHDDGALSGKAPFLRMSNAGSAMCLNCHIRMQ